VWFPTVLSFIAVTLAYVIDPGLANNKLFMFTVMMGEEGPFGRWPRGRGPSEQLVAVSDS